MDHERTPDGIKLATVDGRPAQCPPSNPRRPASRRRKAEPWTPSRREREVIRTCLAGGFTITQTALAIGQSVKALEHNCPTELLRGAATQNSKVVGKLFQKCMNGDTIALLFWCKTRLGWQEKSRVEHTGAEGGAIQFENVEAEAAAFTERILQMAQRFEAAPADNDQTPSEEKTSA